MARSLDTALLSSVPTGIGRNLQVWLPARGCLLLGKVVRLFSPLLISIRRATVPLAKLIGWVLALTLWGLK